MKKLYTILSFSIISLTVVSQTINITFKENKTCPTWENNLSTKEIEKISHSGDSVSITMKNGPTYVYGIDSIDKMVNTPAEDLSSYKNGDLLGITSEEDWSDDSLFVKQAYPSTNAFVSYFKSATFNLIQNLKNSRSTPYELHYHSYNIEYVSTDIDGEKIRMSGRIVYPYSINDGELTPLTLSKVFLENHYTSIRTDQAPTSTFFNTSMVGMIARGYLGVQPDYLGLGSTQNRTQLFINQETMARNVVDCILATMQLKQLVNSNDTYVDIPLVDDAQLINEGASQGASVAVGVQRYIENNLTEEEKASMPPLQETRACSGCYDPYLSIKEYAAWDSLSFCSTIPILLQGTIVAYPEQLVDATGNKLTIDKYFNERFMNEKHAEYNNLTILEMLNSKNYDAWLPAYAMWSSFGNMNTQKAKFSAFMNPEFFTNETTLDTTHPYIVALKNAFELSNNTYGWNPIAPLKLWHGVHDNFVPYDNSTELVNTIKNEYPDANVTLSDINDETIVSLGATYIHSMAVSYWILSELMGLDVNTLIQLNSK